MYPWTALVFAFSALAAFGGFIWAWLVHVLHAGENSHSGEYFWRNFIQRLAVVLAAAVPVVNAPFLANPDWEGTLSQYITLGTLTGAAAIALTPTVRVLALPPRLGPNRFSGFSWAGAGPSSGHGTGDEQQGGTKPSPGPRPTRRPRSLTPRPAPIRQSASGGPGTGKS